MWEWVSCDVIHELETDIGSAISYLQELQRAFEKAGYLELLLEKDEDYDLVLCGVRMETDEEYKDRLAETKRKKTAAAKRKERKRTKEYKEYLKLKEKFEKE